VVGLVVPTGYSFNLDGTNIYMTLAALFIAQATAGSTCRWASRSLLLVVAMLSSKGAAGVTGAGFITLAATLSIVPSVPVAGMALILGVDRFMSECRSLTNFIGNAVATIVVARWESTPPARSRATTCSARSRRRATSPSTPATTRRPATRRAGDVNSINLRNLGVGNTLVLLNGRRLVSHPTSQAARAMCRCWATTPTRIPVAPT
jgi:hypothetical protein